MTDERRFSRTDAQTETAKRFRTYASLAERRIWSVLSRKQRGVSFRRQHPIGPYFADFYCSELKFVIEVDGDWHDPAKDRRRDAYMRENGINTLRFPVISIYETLDGVVMELDMFIRERRHELGGI